MLLEAEAVGESIDHKDIKPQTFLKCQQEYCGSYFSASSHLKCDLLTSCLVLQVNTQETRLRKRSEINRYKESSNNSRYLTK